jgi:hypothetical protein
MWRAEVVRALGGDNPKNPKFLLYDYDAQEEFIIKIRVEAETKTGKVASIDISTDGLPLSKAIELFGKDYIETWYESCNCEPGEASPIFESPDGNHRSIEYRSRGIAMTVDYQGRVISIRFVDKPIGFKSAKECETIPECAPKRKSVRRKQRVTPGFNDWVSQQVLRLLDVRARLEH